MTWMFRRVAIEEVLTMLAAGLERASPVWFRAQGGEVVLDVDAATPCAGWGAPTRNIRNNVAVPSDSARGPIRNRPQQPATAATGRLGDDAESRT